MKTSSHPIQTIITGSKGTVVTYEATRDPKYTTNTKTTTSTGDHGDRVIIYPEVGDPESRDHDHDHDHDHDNSSKSTTKRPKCTTTRPPRCTKTVSFISTGTGYTSTILGTCSPVSGCVSGQQSTTTTTISTFVPTIWIDEPYKPEVPTTPEEVDDGTIQYFTDLFKKEGISLEVDRQLVAHCGGNTPVIPLFCLNTFSADFWPIGPPNMIGGHHIGMQKRRPLVSRSLCSDWSFEFHWSGAHSKCRKSCRDYLNIIETQCLQFKTNDEGSLDAGCGTYSLAIKSVPTTTESPPEIPKTPLELKPAVCADESNFPGHVDVHKSDLKRQAEAFCETYFLDRDQKAIYMSSQSKTVSITGGGLFGDALLHFSVSWVDGCETTVDSQDVMLPVGGDINFYCGNILLKTWADCNNGGVGGYIDAGCLRYQFNPAK
ncbi:hypothetical protein J3F84DRAFT_400307 [Trichoderma pleuroticola]